MQYSLDACTNARVLPRLLKQFDKEGETGFVVLATPQPPLPNAI